MSALLPPLAYECHDCEAKPGAPCVSWLYGGGFRPADEPHESRRDASEDRLCPDCQEPDSLHSRRVDDSDVVVLVCTACGFEDAV